MVFLSSWEFCNPCLGWLGKETGKTLGMKEAGNGITKFYISGKVWGVIHREQQTVHGNHLKCHIAVMCGCMKCAYSELI